MTNISTYTKAVWTLTEFGPEEGLGRTLELPARELIVGRTGEADITIPSNGVSKRHAKLSFERDQFVVEDLGSTNGTHVNGQRIECSIVTEGDLLQFANAVYRVGKRQAAAYDGTREEAIVSWAQTLILFDQLINERTVVPHFQPIVQMKTRETAGFELLARSGFEGLTSPALMFGAAERLGQQARLSELMREEGLKAAGQSKHAGQPFYLNTHPSEVVNERLLSSLRDLRAENPSMQVVIEIHEAAVTDPSAMLELRAVLRELDIKLSYDDFGAGQGRLLELGDVPPDILKFDMQLIRGIDKAAATRQELLAKLVRIAVELGAVPLAEGVETEGEHQVCCELGFHLGQGFLYGRPQTFH